MNKFNIIEKLLKKGQNPVNRWILEKVLNLGIPFNMPHRFRFISISECRTQIKLPFIRKNKNHLGGIHACAIATLGEYPAGLLILKRFGAKEYRLILKNINVDFHMQAKTELLGCASLLPQELLDIEKTLDALGASDILIKTKITNTDSDLVATVMTQWQLKRWDLIKFR